MKYGTGFHWNLYVTRITPDDPKGPGVIGWGELAGQQVRNILKVDANDRSYLVLASGFIDQVWVPEAWIEKLEDANVLRKAWQQDSLTEAARQMSYASAMQRLMWREICGTSAKKQVGDKVKIKGVAKAIERHFPGSWNLDWYTPCWGKIGAVIDTVREMSLLTGELHRGYKIEIPGTMSDGEPYPTLWFLGEDLEV